MNLKLKRENNKMSTEKENNLKKIALINRQNYT